MAGVFDSLLNNTITIERRTRASDGQGGWPIGYGAPASALGRIRPAGSSEREAARLEERQITHVLYLLASADIERGDRVTCGDLVAEVQGIREPSKAGHHLEVDCLEIQKEVDL